MQNLISKLFIIALFIICFSFTPLNNHAIGQGIFNNKSTSDVYVRGHKRSNGTYVKPHYRSSPNSSTRDNWSKRGNTNPYTGRRGTKNTNRNRGSRGTFGR